MNKTSPEQRLLLAVLLRQFQDACFNEPFNPPVRRPEDTDQRYRRRYDYKLREHEQKLGFRKDAQSFLTDTRRVRELCEHAGLNIAYLQRMVARVERNGWLPLRNPSLTEERSLVA